MSDIREKVQEMADRFFEDLRTQLGISEEEMRITREFMLKNNIYVKYRGQSNEVFGRGEADAHNQA